MIPEVAPYNNYTGDSSTTKFDFDFYIEDSTQLVVQLTQEDGTIKTLTNDTDYTIHEVGNKNGSYITFPITGSSYSTLSSSEIISLSLSLPIAQESEYGTSSELDLVGLEYSFDYLTRICQIMNRQVVRALKVAEGSNVSTDELAFDVEKIADIADDISTVSGISADVTAVKNNAANITTVAGSIANVNAVGESIENVNAIAPDLTNIDSVAGSIADINAVAADLVNIDAASDNAILAKQYAVGLPSEPPEGSAKYWAEQAAAGQIQSDWEQSDNTKEDFIKNKPDLSLKQDTLVSGTNIKTINNNSILGSGNLTLDGLPSQTGQSGKYLKTDGTDASWEEVEAGDSLPDQTGHSGDLLTTDGTDASWVDTEEIYPIIETYQNGDSWYRIYATDSTGYRWCEQGGYSATVGTVQFLKAFRHIPYVTFGGYTSTLSYISSSGSTTQMTVAGGGYFYWKASGYIEV